jgi:hypothetical protein
VDDQKITSEIRARCSALVDIRCLPQRTTAEALRLLLKDTPPRLVISELSIPMMSRFELISGIRWRLPTVAVETPLQKPCCTLPVLAMNVTYTAGQIPSTVDAFMQTAESPQKHSLPWWTDSSLGAQPQSKVAGENTRQDAACAGET